MQPTKLNQIFQDPSISGKILATTQTLTHCSLFFNVNLFILVLQTLLIFMYIIIYILSVGNTLKFLKGRSLILMRYDLADISRYLIASVFFKLLVYFNSKCIKCKGPHME